MSDVERSWELVPKEKRKVYIDAIIGFFHTERGEEIGVVAAEEVLDFFIEKIGPAVYNRALEDAKAAASGNLDELLYKLSELTR